MQEEDCRNRRPCYDGTSERAEYTGEEKNILYVASAVLYNPASSQCHGMGSRFIPRYTVQLLTLVLTTLSPTFLISLSLHLSDQLRSFFSLFARRFFFSLAPPCSRINREIVFAPVIITQPRNSRC